MVSDYEGIVENFVIFGTLCYGQTMGVALIRVVPLLAGDNTVYLFRYFLS